MKNLGRRLTNWEYYSANETFSIIECMHNDSHRRCGDIVPFVHIILEYSLHQASSAGTKSHRKGPIECRITDMLFLNTTAQIPALDTENMSYTNCVSNNRSWYRGLQTLSVTTFLTGLRPAWLYHSSVQWGQVRAKRYIDLE